MPQHRTCCGFQISLQWRRGRVSCFVIDAFAYRIAGYRASRTAPAGFVLDALDHALPDRGPVHRGGLVYHSDRGSQYVSIRYSERLAEAGIEPSVGSVGDPCDNALAETVNDLYKAEVIHRRGPWRNFEAVEFAIFEWVDWFNNRRLMEPIGSTPPAEAEERYYAILDATALTAQLNEMASGKPGAVQTYKQCSDKRPVASVFYGSNTASSDSKCDCEWASGYILREMHSGGHLRRKWLEIWSSGEG